MICWFSDSRQGGFYLYASDSEQLISRPKETWDGALPSGNSVAAHIFSLLSDLTGEEIWQKERDRTMQYLAEEAATSPSGHSFALFSMCSLLYPSAQLLCASAEARMPQKLQDFLCQNSLPGLTVLLLTPENKEQLTRIAPFTAHYPIPDRGVRYYLCQGHGCSAGSEDFQKLAGSLKVSLFGSSGTPGASDGSNP